MSPQGHRRERIAEQMREVVAEIVQRNLKDPRIGFVTIMRVDIVHDLSSAKIYFSVLGDDKQRKESLVGLKQATGFVRRELGRRMRMRISPELHFVYDKGVDAAARVAHLLEETKPKPDDGGEPGSEE